MAITEKVQEMVGLTPAHDKAEREKIRSDAKRAATTQWFGEIIDHHLLLEKAFAEVKAASNAHTRKDAQERLAILLTGHSIAEEAIIYPFMKLETSATEATHAYSEQAIAKVQMAALDEIKDKMSQEYEDKLEDIRKAVEHHMIEEERDYFPELQDKADAAMNKKMTQHYHMEFERYVKDTTTKAA